MGVCIFFGSVSATEATDRPVLQLHVTVHSFIWQGVKAYLEKRAGDPKDAKYNIALKILVFFFKKKKEFVYFN